MKMIQVNRPLTWLALAAVLILTACATSPPHDDGSRVETTTSADGSPIVYGVSGRGEPALVFIHCWTCSHEFWDVQINHFSAQRQVIWLDLAGHGASGTQRQHYTMQAFGQDVAAVVEKVGAEQVILVGHSMGGPVAVEAAKLLGDRVVGIVGVDTFYTPFEYPTAQAEIDAFVKPFETDFHGTSEKMVRTMFTPQADPAVVEDIVARFAEADPEVGVSAMYELFAWNATQGAADLRHFAARLYNINAAPTGNEAPPNDHTFMVPGVGHFIAQVKPEAFNRELEGIVARLGQ